MTFIVNILKRECKLYMYDRGIWLQPLIFFIVIAGIFAIILGDEPGKLQTNAPGILWVGIVLSLILSQNTVFQSDNESGCLEMILLSPVSQITLLTFKILTHALVVGLPLLLLSLLVAWIFDVPTIGIKGIAATFSLSIPALCFLCSITTALTIHLKRGGLLLAILVLPLMAPIILFGVTATRAALSNLALLPHLAILCALLLLLMMLAPITCLFALRIGAES